MFDSPIVIVDDEKHILKSYETVLKLAGFKNIHTESDSSRAFGLVRSVRPSVVLLDLIMPGTSGEELLESIVGAFPEISTIVITGNTDTESSVRCMQAGAYDYLVKPVDSTRLETTVRLAIRHSQAATDIEYPAYIPSVVFPEHCHRRPSDVLNLQVH